MTLSIGFSPCPNDTFIFDALVNGQTGNTGLRFEPVLEDVETLNQWALQGKLDITKLSFPAFFQASGTYDLLTSGSALGRGVGPLLISREDRRFSEEEVRDATVLLPGVNTTAHLLFSFAHPSAKNKKFLVFNEIEDALVNGKADLGVIIHENRFTYQAKGLHKVRDLGEYWEEKMAMPIPLGGIVIRKSLGKEIYEQVNREIRRSLEQSFAHYPEISGFVSSHAQTMSEDVMRKHIELYVNDYSLDLGAAGLSAVETLRKVYTSIQMG